jgi:two-component system, chemotaxis family, sensor kinase CheA
MNDNDELIEVFKGEVGQQLEELDERLALPHPKWDLDHLFHLAHNIKGAGRMIGAGSFAELAHALEDIFSELRSGGGSSDVLSALAREGASLLQAGFDRIGAETGEEPSDFPDRVRVGLAQAPGAPPPAPGSGPAAAPEGEEPIAMPEVPGPARRAAPNHAPAPGSGGGAPATLRIGVDKLQSMMGLGTELVTSAHRAELRRSVAMQLLGHMSDLRRHHPQAAHSDLFQSALRLTKELLRDLAQDAVRSHQLSEQLQDAMRQLRMVRVDTVRGLLSRAVRSAAQATGHDVAFHTEGGSTEIDRVILDRLRDPLVHLVRNAVAHGVESREERLAAGKEAAGRVTFAARSAGSWIEIIIEDDGRGVDVESVRAHAIRQGVLDSKSVAAMGPEEVLELLFTPGFSTASTVSELAGRGFGMDIVRTNLSELGGSVSLTSQPGHGVRVRLRAPLTRLTIRGLVVTAAGQPMAFPMMGVHRTIAVHRNDVRTVDAVEVIPVDDCLVPISHVGTCLGLGGSVADPSPAVVLAEGHRQRAFLVDEIIGEREFTIQALPWNLEHVMGVAGAAVTERGNVMLVLNSHELLGTRGHGTLSMSVSEGGRDARQHRVLVVDDSVTSRTLEKNILASAGYDVVLAVNGQAALDLLRETEVDLVVTDVDMPLMSGIELTRAIRATKELEDLPVILVTSLAGEQDRQRGADAGADAYIVKGVFDQDELLRAVARLL